MKKKLTKEIKMKQNESKAYLGRQYNISANVVD